VPLADFIRYGHWFQQDVAPDVDRRRVDRIEASRSGFRLLLEDGDSQLARRVVLATGLAAYASRPAQFATLPSALVSHTSDHHDLTVFAGKRVCVVGGGQSAIETAALLHEGGAEVEIILRAPAIRWLTRSHWLHNHLGRIRHLLYPPSDVGPPILNQIVAVPDLYRRLPLGLQEWIAYRAIRPAASGWLVPRVDQILITTRRRITMAIPVDDGLLIALDDGAKRRFHHAMLATGFRIDVADHPLLSPDLRPGLRSTGGYPDLDEGFESSLAGLHFLGAPAARSFGPLMRFVSGSGYAARALGRRIVGRDPTEWN